MAATFEDFRRAAPGLAEHVRTRLHDRVSYLGTVRRDGKPRVHPVTPGVGDGFAGGWELFVFMAPTSPKGRDLERGSGFALHAGVADPSGAGEVLVTGVSERVTDEATRAAAVAACPYRPAQHYVLFLLRIEEVLARGYTDGGPGWERWRYSAE